MRTFSDASPCVSEAFGVYEGMGTGVVLAETVESVEALYEQAYQRFSADVFRFLLAWTNDRAAAEDLMQETYIRLWGHRASIDWDRPILNWLLVTARRLASNRFRSLRRRLVVTGTGSTSGDVVSARWLDVRQALDTLTPLERTALILVAVEGWSYSDLAVVLKTTDGALRAAVSRARDKLEVA
jgi:RNA polymerase sigma-70 factor (ECF subfamily)